MTMETEMTEIEMRWQERKQEAAEKRQKLVEDISRFVNGADSDELQALAAEMARDHRTLVQLKFKLFLHFAKALSEDHKSGSYDLRNEFAVRGSTKIMEIFSDSTGVPFI